MSTETLTIVLIVFLAALSFIFAGLSIWFNPPHFEQRRERLAEWFHGLSTEMAGAVITGILLTLVINAAQKNEEAKQALESEKQQLISQLGSSVNEVAIRAAEELLIKGWLEDGTLQGVNLGGANLQGARLDKANLEAATLYDANLQGAILADTDLQGARLDRVNLEAATLYDANLQGAILADADLQEVRLDRANLQTAILWYADLQGANLKEVNLQGADLYDANLQGVNLKETKFNENTLLPDATRWTPDTDMTRFTDPEHPQFWRSDEPKSPAYRGKTPADE